MSPPRRKLSPARAPALVAKLRGAVRLAVDGVHGVTHIAEGLHANIQWLAPPLGPAPARRARGIAGWVYGSVRGGARLVGTGVEGLLAGVARAAPDGAAPAPAVAPWQAALNGVLGDHLVRTGNPLAIPLSLHVRGAARPRILLLVHGLCMSDAQWARKGHDHGIALAQALDCTPVYVRYNSGRHISENATELARQVETLLRDWPMPVESLAILGHSMGGLLARSAVRQASDAGMAWPRLLRQMVFLGTPHHGAPLERGGHWLQTALGVSPYLAPFAKLGDVRSDGITDLRHGSLLPDDWQGEGHPHREALTGVPLPEGVACYAVAGLLPTAAARQALGDGLVTVPSALGRHKRPALNLRLPVGHTWIARGVHHLDLLSDAGVYARLRSWLG